MLLKQVPPEHRHLFFRPKRAHPLCLFDFLSAAIPHLFLVFSPSGNRKPDEQKYRENDGCKDSRLQISSRPLSHHAHQSGAAHAAKVTGKRKPGEHGRSAFDPFGRKAEGAGPEHSHGKSAQGTADQAKRRNG